MDNNKSNNNKSNNKTNKVKVHKVPIISSEALALAGKVHSKFPASEYEEVYELLNDFVDSLNVDEDGIITLETFWECGDCIEGIAILIAKPVLVANAKKSMNLTMKTKMLKMTPIRLM